MKKKLFMGLVLLAALLCLCFAAQADSDPLKVSMELSSRTFSARKTITVSIQVTNVGEGDMPSAVTLYYPNGNQVEEFGAPVLSVGASKSWSGSWTVTESQLESGKISFSIKYSIYNENGELVAKTKRFSKAITYAGAVASIEVNRVVTPSVAQKDQEVTVTYEIANTGNIGITDVTIKENSGISAVKGTIDSIAAGEKQSYTFTTKMGSKDLTSEATITYKANGKTHTENKEAVTIKFGQVNLKASLSSDKKGGSIGETATLTLTLKNNGKSDYTGVNVTDAALGQIFSNETVPAGETVTLTKEIELAETVEYRFVVTAVDGDGLNIETATDTVTVKAVSPEEAISLAVSAAADRETVYNIPGTVRFTINVTNNSQVEVKNIKVYAVNTLLYTFDTIQPGATRSFVRDMDISMAGTFAFDARCTDALKETVSFRSNPLYIGFAQPTAVPTEAPVYTPVAPKLQEVPTEDDLPAFYDTIQKVLAAAKWVFAVLAAAGLALVIAALIRRAMLRRENNAAVDQLQGTSARDYSRQADAVMVAAYEADRQAQMEPQMDPEMAEFPAEAEEPVGDAMAEALDRLYGNQDVQQPVPEISTEEPAAEEAGHYRRRHQEDDNQQG